MTGVRVGWRACLAAGIAVVCAAQLLIPADGAPVWFGLQLAGIALTVLAIVRGRPEAPFAWWLVVAARVAGLIGTAWWTLRMAAGGPPPAASQLGLANAAQYALYALAALRLTRRRRSASAIESGFEAGAVVVWVAMLAWCLVVEPYLGKPGFRQVDTGVAAAYAAFDLTILTSVLRSPFTVPRGPARLLGAAGATLLAGHLLYAAVGAAGPAQFLPGGLSFLCLQVWGVLLTAAALHPGAARLGAPPVATAPLVSHLRLVVILLTAVFSPFLPLIALAQGGRHLGAREFVPAILVASLFALMMGRIWLLAGIGQRRARRLDAQADELRHALHEQQVLQDQLQYRAGHDTLTGLANRDLFLERLAAAGDGHAVLLCGLDGFKTVNDAYGHSIGDDVLVRLAARLRGCVGDGELLARLGGDEFGVLVGGGEDRAAEIGERIVRAVADPVGVDGHRLHLTASIGVAAGTTLGDADLALRAAKQGGRDRIARYDSCLRAEQTTRAQIAEGLRGALTDGSLHLQYQPVVDLTTGRTTGVEALMRWHRPGQPISPAEFIPVAEQAGLIGALGAFALRTACREAARWHERHGIYVTVNVSSHQLRDPDFAGAVLAVLAETGLPATALVLEITESVLIDADDAQEHLRTLRAHGVRIAIDDFGTGYSSLAYLHLLPVDILKIDRTFISRHQDPPRPRDVSFTRAILEMAASQGLTAVAEGVETAAQAALLRDLSCPLVQGYYFGRPADPATIDTRLAQQPSTAAA